MTVTHIDPRHRQEADRLADMDRGALVAENRELAAANHVHREWARANERWVDRLILLLLAETVLLGLALGTELAGWW